MRCALRVISVTLACLLVTDSPAPADPQELLGNAPEVVELFNKGEASFLKGDYEKAIRAYSEAFELSDHRSMIALYGIGKTYLRIEKFDKAEEHAGKILELGGTNVHRSAAENLIGAVLLGRALKLLNEKRRSAAQAQAESLFRAENLVGAENLGRAMSQNAKRRSELLTEAESHLRTSLDLSSGQMSIAWLNLSLVLEEQGHLAQARDAQQEYVDRTPGSRSARARLCRLKYLEPVAEKGASTGQSTPEDSDSREEPVQTPERVGGNVQPPVKISAPSPQYTKIARKERVQGLVIVEAILDKTGSVTNVKVLKGLPMGLDKAAALAVCHWQFKPATLNGEPVDVVYNLTVNFRLEKRKKR